MPGYIRQLVRENLSQLDLQNGTYFCSFCTEAPTNSGYLFNLGGIRYFLDTSYNILYTSYYLNQSGWSSWSAKANCTALSDRYFSISNTLTDFSITFDKNVGDFYIAGTKADGTYVQKQIVVQ